MKKNYLKSKNVLAKPVAHLLAKTISFSAIHTVNSACTIGYGQIKEFESLKRYKKIQTHD